MEISDSLQPFIPILVLLLCALITIPGTMIWLHYKETTKKSKKTTKKTQNNTEKDNNATKGALDEVEKKPAPTAPVGKPLPTPQPQAPESTGPILNDVHRLYETNPQGGHVYRRLVITIGTAFNGLSEMLEKHAQSRVVRLQNVLDLRKLLGEVNKMTRTWECIWIVSDGLGSEVTEVLRATPLTQTNPFALLALLPEEVQRAESYLKSNPIPGCDVLLVVHTPGWIDEVTKHIHSAHQLPPAVKKLEGVIGAALPPMVIPCDPRYSAYHCGYLDLPSIADFFKRTGFPQNNMKLVRCRNFSPRLDTLTGVRPLGGESLRYSLRYVDKEVQELASTIGQNLIRKNKGVTLFAGDVASGKSTVAKLVAWDPFVLQHFKLCIIVSAADVRSSQESLCSLCSGSPVRIFNEKEGTQICKMYLSALSFQVLVVIDDVESIEAGDEFLSVMGLGNRRDCQASVLMVVPSSFSAEHSIDKSALARALTPPDWTLQSDKSWDTILSFAYDALTVKERNALASLLHASSVKVEVGALSALWGIPGDEVPAVLHRLLDTRWLRLGHRSGDGKAVVDFVQPIRNWLRTSPNAVKVEPKTVHAAVVKEYKSRCNGNFLQLNDDGYVYRSFLFHLSAEAGVGSAQALFKESDWLRKMYERSGPEAVKRCVTVFGTGDADLDMAVQSVMSSPAAHPMRHEFRTQMCLLLPQTHFFRKQLVQDTLPLKSSYVRGSAKGGVVWYVPIDRTKSAQSSPTPSKIVSLLVIPKMTNPVLLVTGHADGALMVWNGDTGEYIKMLPNVHKCAVDNLIIAGEEGEKWASGSREDKTIFQWTMPDFSCEQVQIATKPTNVNTFEAPTMPDITPLSGFVDTIRVRHPKENSNQHNPLHVSTLTYQWNCLATISPGYPIVAAKGYLTSDTLQHRIAFLDRTATSLVILEGIISQEDKPEVISAKDF